MYKILLCGERSVVLILMILLIPAKSILAQWYIVSDEYYKRVHWEVFQIDIPDRRGDFPSKKECEDALDRTYALDRFRHHCECESNCEGQNSTVTYDNSQNEYIDQNSNEVVVADHQMQLDKIRAVEEKKRMLKELVDQKKFTEDKNELTGKLKQNKALDQLKTSSELSEQGIQNSNNNQLEVGRNNSQSAFTEGKIILKKRDEQPVVPVSPPKPVDNQKSLFEYIEKETKTVQNKIINVQKEKIILLDKKNENHKTIYEQTIKIAQLKTERLEVKDETKIDEIDSLLLMASLLLQESEDLNKEADEELKEKNKIELDNQALLNKYQDVYNKSKENPEQSEQLLKELRGDK